MKQAYSVLLFVTAASAVFGSTKTHSAFVGFYTYSFAENGVFSNEGTVGLSYRFTAAPRDVGFYYGVDATLGFPTYRFDGSSGTSASSPNDLSIIFFSSLGFRWPGRGMGIYLGGGPAARVLFGSAAPTTGSILLLGEIGLETNDTVRIGSHIAFRIRWIPLFFREGTGYVSRNGLYSGLRIGVAWRRTIRDDQ